MVIIPEITDVVRAALDCATSISCKGCSGKLQWLVTTDAESAGQLTARVLTKSEFAHIPPLQSPPFDPLMTHFTTGQRQADRPGQVRFLAPQNVVGHDH